MPFKLSHRICLQIKCDKQHTTRLGWLSWLGWLPWLSELAWLPWLSDLALLADGMNINLPETPNFTPKQFNLLLEKAPTDSDRELLQNAILRCIERHPIFDHNRL